MKQLITAIALASATVAAHALPYVLESGVRSIQANATFSQATVVCGNVPVVVVQGRTQIVTPVRDITVRQLADTTPFRESGFNQMTGAARQGFVGGGCIATGDTVNTINGMFVADVLEIDVNESVYVGVLAAPAAAGSQIFKVSKSAAAGAAGQMDVEPITFDERLSILRPAAGFWRADGTHPAGMQPTAQANTGLLGGLLGGLGGTTAAPGTRTMTITSEAGFGADPARAVAGDAVSVDGYFGAGNSTKMYGHTISIADATLENATPRPSVLRSRCTVKGRGRDDADIRGGCVIPVVNGQPQAVNVNVSVKMADGSIRRLNTSPGVAATAACTPITTVQQGRSYVQGLWRIPTTEEDFGGTCPVAFGAEYNNRWDWQYGGRAR